MITMSYSRFSPARVESKNLLIIFSLFHQVSFLEAKVNSCDPNSSGSSSLYTCSASFTHGEMAGYPSYHCTAIAVIACNSFDCPSLGSIMAVEGSTSS